MSIVRSFNPIWYLVDLQGHSFDDTFYMFVLQNTLPYLPATVWHDPSGNVPWNEPIQFLANGTLPVDIYWDNTQVYRLEFRQGNTQAAPLIYLVENYTPNQGGGVVPPITGDTFITENQITNPQFSLISFASPLTITNQTNPAPIEVAPGWFLNLQGNGTAVVKQIPLNSTTVNPSNAPYALQITLTGNWTGTPYLSQRFNQNGMLWTNNNPSNVLYVSSTVTARVNGANQTISAIVIDSTMQPLATVLGSTNVNQAFNEYTGQGSFPATSNTNVPPNAWIEYQLQLPTNCDIYVTSFQLQVSNLPVEPAFTEDSIERQVDHTFHYYRESLLRHEKNSILVGWDFSLNPWQFWPVSQTNVPNNTYTADQTVIIQQNYVANAVGNNVSVGLASPGFNLGMTVQAVTATNQFAILQYIHPSAIAPYWGTNLSAHVRLLARRQNTNPLGVKMRLIWRTSLPLTISQTNPVASWSANNEPVYASGWIGIAAQNDPVYQIVNGQNVLLFEKFLLPPSTNAGQTLGVLIYTVNSMTSTGTPDNIVFQKVSLVRNNFAIECNSIPYDETLRQCQFYYETSFNPQSTVSITGPQQVTLRNILYTPQMSFLSSLTLHGRASGFSVQYKTLKCRLPAIALFSGTSTTANNIHAYINSDAGTNDAEVGLTSYYTAFNSWQFGFSYQASAVTDLVSVAASTWGGCAIAYHYVADARLGT